MCARLKIPPSVGHIVPINHWILAGKQSISVQKFTFLCALLNVGTSKFDVFTVSISRLDNKNVVPGDVSRNERKSRGWSWATRGIQSYSIQYIIPAIYFKVNSIYIGIRLSTMPCFFFNLTQLRIVHININIHINM